jgi:Ca2+-binding RTX toxin-like protein
MTSYVGTSGNDRLEGDFSTDEFDISQGGRDTVIAGGLDDTIKAGASFDGKDSIDGGDGYDVLELDGDYSAGVKIANTNLIAVENVSVAGGHDYLLNLAGFGPLEDTGYGDWLTIGASDLQAGDEMVVDASALSATPIHFFSGAGDETLKGGGGNDQAYVGLQGRDSFDGGGGNDQFFIPWNAGAGLATINGGAGEDDLRFESDAFSRVAADGGSGLDSLSLTGAFEARISLGGNFTSFETLQLDPDFSGSFRVLDSFLASGATLTVLGWQTAGYIFDGSRETDGGFILGGSQESDYLRGGRQNDVFNENWGNDTLVGGSGDDLIRLDDAHFDAFDRFDGGNGSDTVHLYRSGMSLDPTVLGAATLRSIEVIELEGAVDLTFSDGNVSHGRVLTVDARSSQGGRLRLDGSAETDGRLAFFGTPDDFEHGSQFGSADLMIGGAARDTLSGGGGLDTLIGGDGADKLIGGAYGDTMTGGAGADTFIFQSIDDVLSGSDHWDLITDLNKADVIDLRGIDANTDKAGDQGFSIVTAFTHKAGQATIVYDAGHDVTTLLLDDDGDAAADGKIVIDGDWRKFDHFAL